jgi:PKD repeat protein
MNIFAKKMKRIFWVVGFISLYFSVVGQQPFLYQADDVILKKKVAENPDLIVQYMMFEENFKQLQKSLKEEGQSKTDTLINGRRVIPVVFHVIHTYEANNISDDQILDGLNLLNIDYNKLNADTVNTYSLFKPRAANCQIEFRLARKDTAGNCTSGIIRHYDPETNFAYFEIMSKYAWEPKHYLNVFVVSFIYPTDISLPDGAFIGGMSPFPPNNPLSQALTGGDTLKDGVLIRHDGIGSIGTATQMGGMPINMVNRTFTHETGHYFNLYHPFQNLIGGLIPASSGCPSFLAPNGDEVDDTPPVDQATVNTSLDCYPPGSRNTCHETPDEPDMIENYMDYQWGYCNNIFTLGQKARIDATLNGYRRSLWSKENLIKTGVLDTTPQLCAPKADFYTSTTMVCQGASVTFHDVSFNGQVESRIWEFEGGTPSTSTDANPVVTYNQGGTFKVTLKVYNASGSDSLTRVNYLIVWPDDSTIDAPYVESFEATTALNKFVTINEAAGSWTLKTGTAYNGNKSVYLPNFSNGRAGSKDILITPTINLTSLPAGQHVKVTFKYAYTGKIIPATLLTPSDTAYDKLNVLVSTDCGKTWSNKLSFSGANWITAPPTSNEFVPANSSQWKTAEFSIPAGAVSQYTHMRIKFEFYSKGGNNLYIDDININVLTGLDDELQGYFRVYPSPFDDHLIIENPHLSNENVEYVLRNMLGQVVLQGTFRGSNYRIETSPLKDGVYSLTCKVGEKTFTQVVVK